MVRRVVRRVVAEPRGAHHHPRGHVAQVLRRLEQRLLVQEVGAPRAAAAFLLCRGGAAPAGLLLRCSKTPKASEVDPCPLPFSPLFFSPSVFEDPAICSSQHFQTPRAPPLAAAKRFNFSCGAKKLARNFYGAKNIFFLLARTRLRLTA